MSLKLDFDICLKNACKDLVFSETTGTYNVTYNLTGWGIPNVLLANTTTATLTMTSPSLVATVINLFTHGFPTNNLITDGYTITSPVALVDGQWLFTYTVIVGGVTYTTEINKMFTCNSECCVTKMLPAVIICDTCEESESFKNYNIAWTMLESLKKAAECGDVTSFTSILKIVTKLCKNIDCKTCK